MRLILILALIATQISSCTLGKTNEYSMDDFELTPEMAHPKAKALLKDEFYWSPIDETGPFGSDDGTDAVYGFIEWRTDHQEDDPRIYIKELLKEWDYPLFDWYELEEEKLAMIKDKIGVRLMMGQDDILIAVGFGQFVMEGKINEEVQLLTSKAIQREILPVMLEEFDEQDREPRKKKLEKMLSAVEKMNK